MGIGVGVTVGVGVGDADAVGVGVGRGVVPGVLVDVKTGVRDTVGEAAGVREELGAVVAVITGIVGDELIARDMLVEAVVFDEAAAGVLSVLTAGTIDAPLNEPISASWLLGFVRDPENEMAETIPRATAKETSAIINRIRAFLGVDHRI